MVVGFDIDDTLTDKKQYCIDLCEKYFEETGKRYNLLDENAELMTKMYDWTFDEFMICWNKKGQEYLDNLPVRKEAKLVFDILRAQGNKIVIITQRYTMNPYETSDKWLKKNRLSYDTLVVEAKDKVEACRLHKVDCYVDDRISTCDSLNSSGVKAFVINTYFNTKTLSQSPRVNSLIEYYNQIKNNNQIILKNQNERIL